MKTINRDMRDDQQTGDGWKNNPEAFNEGGKPSLQGRQDGLFAPCAIIFNEIRVALRSEPSCSREGPNRRIIKARPLVPTLRRRITLKTTPTPAYYPSQ